jgi:transposase
VPPYRRAQLLAAWFEADVMVGRQALRGRFSAHHALLLRLALDHVEQPERSITELDMAVDRAIAPFARARDRLDTITGVG